MRNAFFIFLFALSFIGCKQQDITPSFLKINSVEFTTDEATQGANTHAISDIWVFIDAKPLGVFELPCVIPILEEGEHNFIIQGGVKSNGISGAKIRYPFYQPVEITLNLLKNDTVDFTPNITYRENVRMALLEDFEDAGMDFSTYAEGNVDLTFVTDPNIVKYGSKCAGVELSEALNIMQTKTINAFELQRNQDVFIEMDYLNTNTIGVGVVAISPGLEIERPVYLVLNPQEKDYAVWKKVYVDIRPEVSAAISATEYGIHLASILDTNSTAAKVYFDNIKVVRYQ